MTRNNDWCILTCANCKTLELAKSLGEVGVAAYAPVTLEIGRPSPQRTREEVEVPLMAGFVFAQAQHLHTLLTLAHSPSLQYRAWDTEQQKMVTKGHPHFRLFRGGAHQLIPDHELEPLRRLERKPRPKRIDRTFNIGDLVRTDDAGFAGLTGKVVAIKGKKVTVAFPRWAIEPEFPTWSLRPLDEAADSDVNRLQPECDAALAA